MPGATLSYPPEFKPEAVGLARSSPNRSVAQIAKELGVSDNSLRNWVMHFEILVAKPPRWSDPPYPSRSAIYGAIS
jgi:DNA-binding transcriptional regulator YiaG